MHQGFFPLQARLLACGLPFLLSFSQMGCQVSFHLVLFFCVSFNLLTTDYGRRRFLRAGSGVILAHPAIISTKKVNNKKGR
jgi:hypothetical protein